MEKVILAPNVAHKEVEKWLDHKRVKPKHRESNPESIENMVDSFEDGTLVLNEDHSINMELAFPIGEAGKIKTLNFKSRLSVGEIHNNLKGVKSGDTDARIYAYIAALTDQPIGVIRKLDTEDYRVASAIVVFFF